MSPSRLIARDLLETRATKKNNEIATTDQTPHNSAAIAAIVCGLLTIIGIAASIYAFVKTPEIDFMPIYIGDQIVRTGSKSVYLSVFPLFSIFVFAVMTYVALTWDDFIYDATERAKFWQEKIAVMRLMDVVTLVRVSCAGFSAFQVIFFLSTLYRCYAVLVE